MNAARSIDAPSFADAADLLVLRLRPRLAATKGQPVDAELRRGREVLFRVTVDGAGLTLPGDLESATFSYGEPPVELPARLAEELGVLERPGEAVADPEEPLWLEFPPPSGLLAILPWERLLGSVAGCRRRPVLRLPYHAVAPAPVPPGPRRVLLCASSPGAKQAVGLSRMLAGLVEILAPGLPGGSEIHLFPQAATPEPSEEVVRALERWLEGAEPVVRDAVHLHDPRGRDFTPPPRSRSPRGTDVPSPWLTWMSETLGSRGADAVHFVAHGYRSGANGALALAESPTEDRDRRMARFLWAPELNDFLNRVGAWLVGFTSPDPNFSILGLRLLADRLARQRPGPVLLDEGLMPNEAAGRTGLAAAWARLLGGQGEAGLAAAPGLRFQVHPGMVLPAAPAKPPEPAVEDDDRATGERPGRQSEERRSNRSRSHRRDGSFKKGRRASRSRGGDRAEGPEPLAFEGEEPRTERGASDDVDRAAIDKLREELERRLSGFDGFDDFRTGDSATPRSPAPTPPPDAPRWRRAGLRLTEQVLTRGAPGAGADDPLGLARRRGVAEALDLYEELMADEEDR